MMGILLLRQSQVRLLSQRAESHIVGGEEFLLVHPSSSSCAISDGDTFTVTGGWWGNWVTRWLWSMNIGCPVGFTSKVCRYNILGFIEELPSLPAKRFGHACGLLGEVILKCTYIPRRSETTTYITLQSIRRCKVSYMLVSDRQTSYPGI